MTTPPRPNIDVEPLKTDIKEVKTGSINVSPNPSVHGFLVDVNGTFGYKIYDLKGQMLESGNGNDQTTVGTKLPRGVFVIHVNQKGNEDVLKVVKE